MSDVTKVGSAILSTIALLWLAGAGIGHLLNGMFA